jgi:putative transposase
MPAKNLVRIEGDFCHYHVYNRGVEKRIIFEDEQDYKVFLNYLKEYLNPPLDPSKIILQGLSLQNLQNVFHQPKNYFGKVKLLAYCLMPNHFHLFLYQKDRHNIERFMRSLVTRYSMYFNKKYKRVGSLFQGAYKSILIQDEQYFLHLSRYIHLNPLEYTKNLVLAYSSYAEYLGLRKTSWIHTEKILAFFGKASKDFIKTENYKDFVERYDKDSAVILENLTLE